MKFVVLNVPYVIIGDATGKIPPHTWDAAREPYADYLIDLITASYIPDLKAKILKRVAPFAGRHFAENHQRRSWHAQ